MCSLEDSSGLFVQTQNSPPGVFFATTSAFLKACEVGRPEEVRSLLLLGADVNWRREDTGWSGLHLSANNNNRDVLDLLLSQPGVNVNISSHRRTTPLMVACFRGHADIVRRLRQVAGADLNCGHTDGWTVIADWLVRTVFICVTSYYIFLIIGFVLTLAVCSVCPDCCKNESYT